MTWTGTVGYPARARGVLSDCPLWAGGCDLVQAWNVCSRAVSGVSHNHQPQKGCRSLGNWVLQVVPLGRRVYPFHAAVWACMPGP